MHCLFVVQASAEIGLGHLMRCLALAQSLSDLELDATFLLDAPSREIAKERHDWAGEVLVHDYHCAVQEQIEAVRNANLGRVDWVVIDGYQFDSHYCQAWRDNGFQVMLFDDGVHQRPLSADVIVSAGAEEPEFHADSVVLAGADYRLLRREFRLVNPTEISQRHMLAINFGGSDPANLTLPILAKLQDLQCAYPIRVVTGASYTQLDTLNTFLKTSTLAIQHIHNAQDMADVWSHASLAISAAGGSQFELAVCATPAILVMVAENQRTATLAAERAGGCSAFDLVDKAASDGVISAICDNAMALLEAPQRLQAMQNCLLNQNDTGGNERILTALVEYDA